MTNSQRSLFRRIQQVCFALVDVNLYLDTHPADRKALDFFHRYRDEKDKLMAEYATQYGPLNIDSVKSKDAWTWIENPWPWEMED